MHVLTFELITIQVQVLETFLFSVDLDDKKNCGESKPGETF